MQAVRGRWWGATALATSLMWRGMLTHAKGDLTSAEGHYDEMARVGKDQANFAESYAFALLIIRRDQQRLPELLDLPATPVPGLSIICEAAFRLWIVMLAG
jgi:hypothetical protein